MIIMTYKNCLSKVGHDENLDKTEVFVKHILKFVQSLAAVLLINTNSTKKHVQLELIMILK